MFNNVRINCSDDCIYVVWHAFNHKGQLMLVHATHAVGECLLAILTQCFKDYFKFACGVFARKPLSRCDYRTSPLCGGTRDHSRVAHT